MRLNEWAIVAAIVIWPLSGWAEGLVMSGSTSSRSQIFSSQARVLDGRLSDQYQGSNRLRPGIVVPRAAPVANSPYLEAARSAAYKHGLPEEMFLRLIEQESRWRVDAKSPKGAIGLTQLMPETARKLRVDPHDPVQNLEGGARYLSQMYRRFGSWRLALAAYNAGPAAVEKYDDVPPYRETMGYVTAILGR